MKHIFVFLALISVFIAPVVYARQDSANQILQSQTGLSLKLESADFPSEIDSYTPNNGLFVVLSGTLSNTTNGTLCPYAREVILKIDNDEYQPRDYLMAALQNQLKPYRDYIGSAIGQCVNGGQSAPTFVVYDVPRIFNSATLSFQGVELNLFFTGLTPTPSPSPTITPSQTNTLTPTLTFTPSTTPTPTATFTPSSTPSATSTPIHGSVVSNETNARGCPSTSCGLVHVVNISDDLQIIGIDFGWYLVELPTGEQAYIRSDLVRVPEDIQVPNAPTLAPSAAPTSTARPTNTQPRPTTIHPTPTEAPYLLNGDDVLSLIHANMQINGYEVDSISNRNGNLLVNAPATSPDGSDDSNYRISYMGYLVGSIVGAYRAENVNANPPSNIIVQFTVSQITLLRITVRYSDAVSFTDGKLTAVEFIGRWTLQ